LSFYLIDNAEKEKRAEAAYVFRGKSGHDVGENKSGKRDVL
jgi:hypothetical protein